MQQHALVLWFHAPLPIDRCESQGEGQRHMDIQVVAPKLCARATDLLSFRDNRFDPKTMGFLKAYAQNDKYPYRAAQRFLADTHHVDVDVNIDTYIGPSWDTSRTSRSAGVWFNDAIRYVLRDTEEKKEWWEFWKPSQKTSTSWRNSKYPETKYMMGRWQATVRSHIKLEAERINSGYYAGYEPGQSFAMLYVVPHGIPYELIYGSGVNDEHAEPFCGFIYVYQTPEEGGDMRLLRAERHEGIRGKLNSEPVIQGDP